MKAVVVTNTRTLAVETVADPVPGRDQVVLRVGACGICGSDLHAHQMGILPTGCVMGHEFAGEVMETAHGWTAGDRACALPAISCGCCDRCLTGLGIFCTRGMQAIGLGQAPGAYAEFIAVSSHHMVRLPEGIDMQHGALVEPLAVGLHAVNVAHLRAGETLVMWPDRTRGAVGATLRRQIGRLREVSGPTRGRSSRCHRRRRPRRRIAVTLSVASPPTASTLSSKRSACRV